MKVGRNVTNYKLRGRTPYPEKSRGDGRTGAKILSSSVCQEFYPRISWQI